MNDREIGQREQPGQAGSEVDKLIRDLRLFFSLVPLLEGMGIAEVEQNIETIKNSLGLKLRILGIAALTLRVIYWLPFYIGAIWMPFLMANTIYPTVQEDKLLTILLILPVWMFMKGIYHEALSVPAKKLDEIAAKLR